MPVEYQAPEGIARLEEHLSLKLSMHMLVAGVIISNAGYMGQQYKQNEPFKFTSDDKVTVVYHDASAEFIVNTDNGAIKYFYDFHTKSCHRITLYDKDGSEMDANPDMVQESYEMLVDYTTRAVIDIRKWYEQQVEETKKQKQSSN